jgi:hypothetical protein
MLRITSALALLLVLSTTASTQQPQGQPATASGARAEVQKFVNAYIDAHNRADATSLSEAMSRRAEVSSGGGAEPNDIGQWLRRMPIRRTACSRHSSGGWKKGCRLRA